MKLNNVIVFLLLLTACCQLSRPVERPLPSLLPSQGATIPAAVPDTTSGAIAPETAGYQYAAPSGYDPAVADLIGAEATELLTATPPLAVYFARTDTTDGLYFDSDGRPEGFMPRLLPPDLASIVLRGLLTPAYYGTSDLIAMCPYTTSAFFQFVYPAARVNVYLLPDCEQLIIKMGDRQRGYRAAELVELLNTVTL